MTIDTIRSIHGQPPNTTTRLPYGAVPRCAGLQPANSNPTIIWRAGKPAPQMLLLFGNLSAGTGWRKSLSSCGVIQNTPDRSH